MTAFETFDFLYRIILIGDSGVGKSNLISRYTNNEFDVSSQATIGVDFSNRNVRIGEHTIKAQIWDTAGQDRFKSISQAFYRGSAAALVVFDITNPKTFESLDTWMGEIDKYADKEIVLMLVGNKSDMAKTRAVDYSTANKYATSHNMGYIETSALDTTNVEEAFMLILNDVYKQNLNKNQEFNNFTAMAEKIETESNLSKIKLRKESTGQDSMNGCC